MDREMQIRLKRMLEGKPRWTKNEEMWHGVKKLGYGGQGCAGLFVKIDPKTQLVVDRVVVKETRDMRSLSKNGYSTTEPLELFMSNKLSRKTNTIKVFAHRLNPDKESYRLYMEYCALGDLTARLKRPYQQRNLSFPEPFLWKLFLDLAHATEDMDKPVGDGLPRDSFIAHIDFKPDNVFMCPPDKDNFPKYPTAKLGDFGGAMLSHPHERWLTHVEKASRTFRTLGNVAPEVHHIGLDSSDPHDIPQRQRKPGLKKPLLPRVTTTTNVWNAALIIGELMFPEPLKRPKGLVMPPNKILFYNARDEWIDKFIQRKDYSMPQYSPRLKNLVVACLDYFPENRPSPAQLVSLVKAGITENATVMSTRDCLDATKYDGRHDLDRNIRLTDDWILQQPRNDEDYDLADDVDHYAKDEWATLLHPSSSAKAGATKSRSASSHDSDEDETADEAAHEARAAALDFNAIGLIATAFKGLLRKL